MKRKLKILVSCLATAAICVCMLTALTRLTERKDSAEKYRDFFEEEQDFDVLFVGSSRILNAVYPMKLWDEFGIVSYNFGGHASRIPTSYWVLRNALDYTNPELVVIDTYLWPDDVKISNDSYMHSSLDAFPISIRKAQAVMDLFQGTGQEGDQEEDPGDGAGGKTMAYVMRTRLEMLWDFCLYHGRWNELTERDFHIIPKTEKGAEIRINIGEVERPELIGPDEMMTEDTYATEYLCRMIEECQRRGIDVLLTFYPSSPGEGVQKQENRVAAIAGQYGVNFINFVQEDIVNYETDFWDQDHVNPSGARKVTAFLGEYIHEKYDIPDRRAEDDYSHWNKDHEEYEEFLNDILQDTTDFSDYLMLLAGDNVDVIFDIRDGEGLRSGQTAALLHNLACDEKEPLPDPDTDFIIVKNGGEKDTVLRQFRENGTTQETEFGNIGIYYNESGDFGLYADGEEIYLGTEENKADIEIIVRRNGEPADHVLADYDLAAGKFNMRHLPVSE